MKKFVRYIIKTNIISVFDVCKPINIKIQHEYYDESFSCKSKYIKTDFNVFQSYNANFV